jgi:alanine racemase
VTRAAPGAQAATIPDRLREAGLPPLPRRAWLEIDTEALRGNVAAVRSLLPSATRLAAVVKADGYGHGLEVAARTFEAAGVDVLCVAGLDEAMQLRAAGIGVPLLSLYAIPARAAADAARAGIEVVVATMDDMTELSHAWTESAGIRGGAPLRVHLEIETGLGRAGIRPDEIVAFTDRLAATPGIDLVGLWSHLSEPADAAFAAFQAERLGTAAQVLEATGLPIPPMHLAGSGGVYSGNVPPLSMVRIGLALYGELADGLPIGPAVAGAAEALRPAMRLVANAIRVEQVAEGEPIGYGATWRAPGPSVVATLPIGYGDGYERGLSPGAEVLVRGRRVPVVGAVAMDALAVDVTAIDGIQRDDEFVLLGAQGGDRITVAELARLRTTIRWEVLTSMARRIPRVYDAPAGLVGMRTLAGEFLVGS